MAVTVDCGEGKHGLCVGNGRTAYLFPQESRGRDEPPFACGCACHHDGGGVPCQEPECVNKRLASPAEGDPMGETTAMWCQKCGEPVERMVGSIPPGGTAESRPCRHKAGVTGERPAGGG